MTRPPRSPKHNVFSDGRGMHMIWVGMLMAGIALSLQGWAIRNGLHWQTMVFNVLCLCQLGHVLAIRSERQSFFTQGILTNKPLIGAVCIGFILQFAITYIPFFQPIFKTESLSLNEFILVVAASSLVFFAVEVEKIISRKRSKKRQAAAVDV